jgi:hypothetical protein
MKDNFIKLLCGIYFIGFTATDIYLTFLDGYVYTWWNWIVALPVNTFLATIWPIYWAILRWL